MRAALKLPIILLVGVGAVAAVAVLVMSTPTVDEWHLTPALVIVSVVTVTGGLVLLGMARLLRTVAREIRVDTARHVGGALSLAQLASANELAPLGDSALSPAAAGRLVATMREYRPRTIMEFGSGSSTLLMSSAAQFYGLETHIHSVEHDPMFAEMTRRQVSGAETVTVHLSRLEPRLDGLVWYALDIDAVSEAPIDLLVVDGPPDVEGRGHRSLAMRAVYEHLAPDALIIVDDADRAPEREMILDWISTYHDIVLRVDGRDHVVLQRVPLDASPVEERRKRPPGEPSL